MPTERQRHCTNSQFSAFLLHALPGPWYIFSQLNWGHVGMGC